MIGLGITKHKLVQPGGDDSLVGNLPNLEAWFDDEFVLESGDTLVAQWTDKSGNGNHATATGSQRPSYVASGINSLPSISTTSGSTWLNGTGLPATQPLLVMMVLVTTITSAQFPFGEDSGGSNKNLRMRSLDFRLNSGSNLSGGTGFTVDVPFLVTFCFNGASSFVYKNQVLQASGNAGSNAGSDFRLGSRGTSIGMTGQIAEVIITSDSTRTAEIIAVEDELITKYNL